MYFKTSKLKTSVQYRTFALVFFLHFSAKELEEVENKRLAISWQQKWSSSLRTGPLNSCIQKKLLNAPSKHFLLLLYILQHEIMYSNSFIKVRLPQCSICRPNSSQSEQPGQIPGMTCSSWNSSYRVAII